MNHVYEVYYKGDLIDTIVIPADRNSYQLALIEAENSVKLEDITEGGEI